MQREQRSQVDGYIVKLYEKIASEPQQASNQDAMFMIWMNFDYMDVIQVSDFHDFAKSLDAHDLKDREKYQSRQKLFIYPLGEDQGLILSDSVLKDVPLITLTFLDLQRPIDESAALDELSLQQKMIECIECKDHVKGQLYGSLSNYDYVLVLRGRTYAELGQILSDYQKSLMEKDILLNKTYTIQGIDLKFSSSWVEEPNSDVSIRVSCNSYVASNQFYHDSILKEALQDGYSVFSLMGKYDYDIMAKIRDTKKFLKFFDDSGESNRLRDEIYKTNTRFMNLESKNTVAEDSSHNPPGMLLDDDLDQWIKSYLELNELCPSIKESLLRLILRISQAITVVSRKGMKEDLRNLLSDFLDFLKIDQDKPENQDEFGEMINCINLLLDNRIIAGMADFEMPHNVLRYSGADLKVLLAYSKFTDKLFSILQLYKRRGTESLKYVHLVTTGTGAKITATVYFSYCEKYRFININIPVNMLFEAQYVLPWITHEVGHFIRAGWKRCDRNAAYWRSISRVLADTLREYTNTDRLDDPKEAMFSEQVVDDSEGKKFDLYRESVYQYCQEIITKGVYGYKKSILIPYNHADNLMNRIEEITQILQKVYEESIADIFMIQVLNIKSLAEYLGIQNAYYHHINVDVAQLPLQNIARIITVSIIIEELNIQKNGEIENHFREVYDPCEDENILPIMRQMKEYKNYYMLEPLISFVKEQVVNGLDKLLQEDKFSDICNELRQSYNSLKGGDFKPFRDFVEGV